MKKLENHWKIIGGPWKMLSGNARSIGAVNRKQTNGLPAEVIVCCRRWKFPQALQRPSITWSDMSKLASVVIVDTFNTCHDFLMFLTDQRLSMSPFH